MKYGKIEFWIATTFFIGVMIMAARLGVYYGGNADEEQMIRLNPIANYYFPLFLMIVTTYAAFLVLNYVVLPRFWFTKKYILAVVFVLLVFIAVSVSFTVTQSYTRSWIYTYYHTTLEVNLRLLSRGFTIAAGFLLFYTAYVLLREFLLLQYAKLSHTQNIRVRMVRDVVLSLSIWLGILVVMMMADAQSFFRNFGTYYLVSIPFCLFVYFVNLYGLIPYYKNTKRFALLIYIATLLVTIYLAGFLQTMVLMTSSFRFSYMGYLVFVWLAPSALATGVSWWVYLANRDTYQQLANLQTELGASNANLQFLRSQINPHFLFNALNTLYGTALTEQAEKTGEGIQKLGDMMRFMLHENNQEIIPLESEISYLHNYIDLQNLRIATSSNISININITDEHSNLTIAPMLLIPFIENAYKHGISFKQPSVINVGIALNGSKLQLDVQNSIHPLKGSDPEQKKSGIGLANVKQRLQLLYANKHQLTITQTETDFTIRLTLQLS